MLLLALVLQPALAIIGEVHELSHGPDAAHAVFEVDTDSSPAAGTGDEGGETLHLLAHFAHCCSPAAGILPTTPATACAQPVASRQSESFLTLSLRSAFEDMLRPPIQA